MANESYPESAIVPGPSESNQEDVIDPEETARTLKYSVRQIGGFICLALYLIGFFSNISIILVFLKDGFSSSTNISFFSLALADLTVCVTYCTYRISVILAPICSYCWKISREYNFYLEKVELLLIAMATWITVILCWERLCCIAYPMKVKRIFSPKFTTGMILGYLLFQALGAAVNFGAEEYTSLLFSDPSSYDFFSWELNDCAKQKVEIADQVRYYTAAIAIIAPNVIMYALLLLGTILFVIVFKRSIQARKSLTAKTKPGDSARERKLMRSVLAVCILYTITSAPKSVDRVFENLFLASDTSKASSNYFSITTLASFTVPINILQSINHCFNIFVYLSMNSKFRRIFCQMFCLKMCNEANQSN